MMNQVNIISDLIKWIEKNLEQALSIDHVAQKSGYSKWHLQRMFKKVTGQVLGTYIRHRRLTHAALALRLTSKPILDIAMQYRFDSQQTFTRSFKKQFNLTPASYRRSEYWEPNGITPAIELYKTQLLLPEPTFFEVPEQVFWGITYKNNWSLNELFKNNFILRKEFFTNYFAKNFTTGEVIPERIYAFNHVMKNKEHLDEQEVFYIIALEDKHKIENAEKYTTPGGLYLSFKFIGHPGDLGEFITQIFLAALPVLKVKLRQGYIIEIHYNRNKNRYTEGLENLEVIECDYCVPVSMI